MRKPAPPEPLHGLLRLGAALGPDPFVALADVDLTRPVPSGAQYDAWLVERYGRPAGKADTDE